jgi:hypothetical protein
VCAALAVGFADVPALPPSSDFGETSWHDATPHVEESGVTPPPVSLPFESKSASGSVKVIFAQCTI